MMEIIQFLIMYPFFQFLGEAIIFLLVAYLYSRHVRNYRPFWLTLAVWSIAVIVGTIIVGLYIFGVWRY